MRSHHELDKRHDMVSDHKPGDPVFLFLLTFVTIVGIWMLSWFAPDVPAEDCEKSWLYGVPPCAVEEDE